MMERSRFVALGLVQFSLVRFGLAVPAFNVMLCFALFFCFCYFRINLYNKLSSGLFFVFLPAVPRLHSPNAELRRHISSLRAKMVQKCVEYVYDNDKDSFDS